MSDKGFDVRRSREDLRRSSKNVHRSSGAQDGIPVDPRAAATTATKAPSAAPHPTALPGTTTPAAHVALLCFQGLLLGATDSLNVLPFVLYCIQSPRLLLTVRDCVLMNGILFASVWLLSQVFMMLPINTAGLLAGLWQSLFAALWVLPIYTATQLLGLSWYESLYRTASTLKHQSLGATPPSTAAPSFALVSELLIKAVVTLIYGIVAVLAGLVPHIGPILSFVMASWLHAFYCFDYRFLDQRQYDPRSGVSVPLRLTHVLSIFERRSAYFLGFGATHIGMRVWLLEGYFGLSMFPSLAVCSAVYALNVVMSVDARPGPLLPFRVAIFTPAYSGILKCFRFTRRKPQLRDAVANAEDDSPALQQVVEDTDADMQ